jgi:hypothetical protein
MYEALPLISKKHTAAHGRRRRFFYLPSFCRPRCQESPSETLHGLIYPEERDPRPFQALSRLKREVAVEAAQLQIDLRASGEEGYYTKLLREFGIEDLVNLLPAVPYQQALQEAATADALLLLQGVTCNHQIPAKTYEYFRLRRPILALTTHEGDTAALLRDAGGATIVDMYSADAIYTALSPFFESTARRPSLVDPEKPAGSHRRNQAHQLGQYLSQLANSSKKA